MKLQQIVTQLIFVINSSLSFERNSVDIIRIDVEDIGKPTKLRVGHDGKGSRPHWYLEKVILKFLSVHVELDI